MSVLVALPVKHFSIPHSGRGAALDCPAGQRADPSLPGRRHAALRQARDGRRQRQARRHRRPVPRPLRRVLRVGKVICSVQDDKLVPHDVYMLFSGYRYES